MYFQDRGVAEFEANGPTALRKIYYSISGDAPSLDTWLQRPAGGRFLDNLADPQPFPAWLTAEDLDYFAENFEASGFRGPINLYHNHDTNFAEWPGMGAAPGHQPSACIAGSKDVVRHFVAGACQPWRISDAWPSAKFHAEPVEGCEHHNERHPSTGLRVGCYAAAFLPFSAHSTSSRLSLPKYMSSPLTKKVGEP